MKSKKPSDENVKIVAGASQLVVSAFSGLGTLIAILQWPLERKIILLAIFLVLWLAFRLFIWGWKRRRSSRKKIPRLLDLYLEVQNRLHPEFRNILLKAMIFRMIDLALIVIILTIIFAIVLGFAELSLRGYIESLTPTPTSTQTLTITPSSTVTLTLTEKPVSDSLYYMIVYDSSRKMNESFHGQKKWEVARNLLVELINGLNPRAQYSLAVVGGTNPSGDIDPCANPISPAVEFSSGQGTYNYLGGLQPQGGGSFYKAYVLAKNQLEDLPKDTVRTLIYITGSSDTCETQDEWAQIKNLISIPDSTFNIYSQIIILDEDGIRSQTLADQFNSLSNNNINAQAPQSISEIQSGGVTLVHIVNNVTTYVNAGIAAIATERPTLPPTYTATPKPGETVIVPPTSIPTDSFTFTPTFTKTVTPSPVPPPTSACPFMPPASLIGSNYGGSASIYSPSHCSTGHTPESPITTNGTFSDIPAGTTLWVLVYAPDGLYYPQSPNACAGAPPPNQGGGSWNVDTYLGLAGQSPTWYDIVVVLTDQAASDYLTNWLITGCSSGFPGIDPGVLSQMNITAKEYITVQTR